MDRDLAVSIQQTVRAQQITRLCHLTPYRNLVHLACGDGLLSLIELARRNGEFDPQDLERYDGHRDHISCSIEYPNGWYLRQRRRQATHVQRLFPDWVCLAIDRALLWAPGTRVCVRNAATMNGALIRDISPENLQALYGPAIPGSWGYTRQRGSTHLEGCPTDDQAEVLVHRAIPWSSVQKIIVKSEDDAVRMDAGLRQIGARVPPSWAVAPMLFDPGVLSAAIRRGERPPEEPWGPGDE